MNEDIDYAEMLEIPVETVTVKHKEKKRRVKEPDLQEQLLEQVNDRMEEEPVEEETDDPAFAESKEIVRDEKPAGNKRRARRILLGEFVAVCALCAVIFLTNIFMSNSAINTFVRGLFQGTASTADTRVYSDFTLASVVNDTTDAEITVSGTGVLSFTAECSVYSPCAGTVAAVNGNDETGYTLEIAHSDTFSTIISGLDYVYVAKGNAVYNNLPVGYSNGEGEVRVMFYEGDELLNCCVVNEDGLAWS